MLYKTVGFLFLILLVVQHSLSQTSTINEVRVALDNLRYGIVSELNTAFITYTNLSQLIDSAALQTKSNGTIFLQSLADEYYLEFENIVEQAENAGVDITQCLLAYEDKIRNLGPDNINDFLECVNMDTNSAIDYLHSAAHSTVVDALVTIRECEKSMVHCGISDGDCLYQVDTRISAQAWSASISIPFGVRNDWTYVQVHIDTIQTSCSFGYSFTINNVGKTLIDDFTSCVDAVSKN